MKRVRFDSLDDFDEHGEEEENLTPAVPVPIDTVVSIQHVECFGCLHINTKSIESNESYRNMMKLYAENSFIMSRESLFRLVKEFFDTVIKPELEEIADEGDGAPPAWSLDCIREHFNRHTRFPTDEICKQIQSKRGLRDVLADLIVEKQADGAYQINHNNLKAHSQIEKDIIALYKQLAERNKLGGYSGALDL